MRKTIAVLVLLLAFPGCQSCKKKAPPKKADPAAKSPVEPQPPVEPKIIVSPPSPAGSRRISAPGAEEFRSYSASPAGDLVVAASSNHIVVLDPELKSRIIPFPANLPDPHIVGLDKRRAALFSAAPGEERQGRLWILDLDKNGEPIAKVALDSRPMMGAALDGGRLVLVHSDPPLVEVYDADGNRLGRAAVPAGPTRLEVSADGKVAALACAGGVDAVAGGVVLIDAAGGVKPLTAGQGRPHVVIALPVGDKVIVAGKTDTSAPFLLAVPQGAGEAKPLALGVVGDVVGAGVAGGLFAVFLDDRSGQSVVDRSVVFDAGSLARVGVIEAGPSLADQRTVALGDKLAVAACRTGLLLDLAGLSASRGQDFPSVGRPGICLDGLVRLGDKLVARDGSKLVAWDIARP